MSPIPSVATALTLSPIAPSTALDPGTAGQSPPVMSQHLLGTGGLLFAVVAIVSVMGYIYRARGAVNSTGTGNTWTSFSSLLSSMRHRGSPTTSTGAGTELHVDVELGPEHVSMVYARFFHPMFWNVVECHPATPSAPAIYVEDEAKEIPIADPKLPGMNSFLDMDDDMDGIEKAKLARAKLDRDVSPRVGAVPPYDTSSAINVNFTNEIIGTTVRPGGFLNVPGEPDDDSTGSSSSDFVSVPEEADDVWSESSWSDSEMDLSLAYDGIATSPPRSPPSSRRHGMAEMGHLARSLKDAIPEEGYALVPTISRRDGLLDISKFAETDPAIFRESRESLENNRTISNCDIGFHDSRDGFQDSLGDNETLEAPHEGVDLMRKLLAELRDPSLDCTPRALSEDSESEYDGDDDGEEVIALNLSSTWRRNSLESTSFIPSTDGDMSDEGPIYPLTPPARLANVLDDHKARVVSLVAPWFEEEVQVISPTFSHSLPLFPSKTYISAHQDTGSPSEGSESGYDDEEAALPYLTPTWHRNSPESTSFTRTIDSDVSSEGPVYRSTPPLALARNLVSAPDVHKAHVISPVAPRFKEEVRVISQTFSQSPAALTAKAYARAHRGTRAPRVLSEDSQPGYDDEEVTSPRLPPTWRRNSLEPTSSTSRIKGGVSDKGPIYPSTPPVVPASNLVSAPDVHKVRVVSPVAPRFNKEVQVTQSMSSDPHPSFPAKASVRLHRNIRSPGAPSEDNESKYNDDYDDEEAILPYLSPTLRRNSPESTLSTGTTDGDGSSEGTIYPLKPPAKHIRNLASIPDGLKACLVSSVAPQLKGEVQASMSSDPPPSFPNKVDVRAHRDGHSPLALSEDSESEYDNDDDEGSSAPRLQPIWCQNSPESTSATNMTNGDVSDGGPICLSNPPAMSVSKLVGALDCHKARMASPVALWFKEEVQVVSLMSSGLPPSFPNKAYIRAHRDARSPRLPLMDLPRL